MVAVKLQNFGGMIPAVDDRLLPTGQAVYARNTWLYTGAIRGINTPAALYTLSNPTTKKVYRIPKLFTDSGHFTDSYWMEFQDFDTDVIHTPVSNDAYNRIYWASASDQPRYAPLATIIAATPFQGANGYLLGVPNPTVAPGVAPAGGASGTNRTTAYVYTWVTAYGEESGPSPATLATNKIDATWTITPTAIGAVATGRNVTKTRIYRTVTSSAGVATYFFVTELPVATLTYADTALDATVGVNAQLTTNIWGPPPVDLQGMCSMPNGMVVGFRSNELWFCEPYRPHAWPTAYTLTLEHPIIGIGTIGQTVVALTTSTPYASMGTTPGSMTLTKIGDVEPCYSRGSIISEPAGVVFASPNGLMLASQGVVSNVTLKAMTKDKWLDLFDITQLRAARVGNSYYAFGNLQQRNRVFEPTAFDGGAFEGYDYTFSRDGFIYDGTADRVSVSVLIATYPTINIMTDPWTGEAFIIRNGAVFWLDISETAPREDWFWRSMVFQPTIRKNFEAMRIWFDNDQHLPVPTTPLHTGDMNLPAGALLMVGVKADGVYVMQREVRRSGDLIRLPSGFKATFWQVELFGRVTVSSVEMATSAKELISV